MSKHDNQFSRDAPGCGVPGSSAGMRQVQIEAG